MRSEVNSPKVEVETDDEAVKEKIAIGQMAQRNEVWKPNDDWTGLADSQQRRKLQNRLNQRLWRKRHQASNSIRKRKKDASKAGSHSTEGSSPSIKSESCKSSSPELVIREIPSGESSNNSSPTLVPSPCSVDLKPPNRGWSHCNMTPEELQKVMTMVERNAMNDYILGSPRVDRLLTLIQYNVFRGLIDNSGFMGFGMEWLDCTAISPFFKSPEASNTCPVSLRPTALQRKIEHHPWIDLFPFPRMRNNMLKQGEDYDDEPLCRDMIEFAELPQEKSGLILWSEPWDPQGWEVSDEFVKRWGWMICGCWELMESTNRYRQMRGEKLLFPPSAVAKIRDRAVQEIE